MLSGLAAWLITGIISPQVAERFMYVPAGILLGLALAAAAAERTHRHEPETEEPRTTVAVEESCNPWPARKAPAFFNASV